MARKASLVQDIPAQPTHHIPTRREIMAAEKKADTSKKKAQAIAAEANAADKAAKEAKKAEARAARELAAAQREAEQKKLAAEKEEAKQKVLGKLEAKAKEVKYKLGKAAEVEKKGDEYRLSAALVLKEAAEALKPVGISFKSWAVANLVDENVRGTSYSNLKELYRIGTSENPAQALADLREGNKQANKALRDSKKGQKALPGTDNGKKGTKKTELQAVEETVSRWPDSGQVEFARKLAKKAGMAVISESAAKSLGTDASKSGTDKFTALWDAAKTKERMEIVSTIETKTGNRFVRSAVAELGLAADTGGLTAADIAAAVKAKKAS